MALTLIQGGEEILADRAISAVISQAAGASVLQLDGETIELGLITDSLAPSLFGEQRVIVIRHIQELASDAQEEITSFLDNPDEQVHLVLWHKGGVKGKALLERIKKEKPHLVAAEVLKKDGDKNEFVKSEFARLGRTITADAIAAIVSALGSDMRELSGVCSQLASDTPAGKKIEVVDVEKFQQGRIETTGFDVADAVLEGKTDFALITLRRALETGVDPVLIVTALSSSLRTLAKVAGAPRGVKSFELASSLALPPWQIDKARRQLALQSPSSLARAVVLLAQTDADIKGAASDPIFALERAVIEICRGSARI
jgi:DNA polymerase III subunit delta